MKKAKEELQPSSWRGYSRRENPTRRERVGQATLQSLQQKRALCTKSKKMQRALPFLAISRC